MLGIIKIIQNNLYHLPANERIEIQEYFVGIRRLDTSAFTSLQTISLDTAMSLFSFSLMDSDICSGLISKGK